ncbi:trypsin-like serine protease [Arthrobacter sp. ISL-95]|uniref:trypsin-like serine protease n=1 Tax=Arthrobacter sp. ISL-95 TaxID=2819116 RepID=UPI001BE8EE17|nr:trypsin-like serine protease [Arthrobacter sp. ISL-95]MBT2585349.1 trypsin-like serine protease [Arthrobacter sp. ISL-95]
MKKTTTAALIAVTALAVGGLIQGPAHAVSGTPVPDGEKKYLVKVDTGTFTCTGSLVDPYWVATSASCLASDPAQFAAVKSGVPVLPKKIKVLTGTDAPNRKNHGIGVVHVETPTDLAGGRDVAMLRLARPVTNAATLRIATTEPVLDEVLSFAGHGRDAVDWVPLKPSSATFSVAAVTGSSMDVVPPTDATGLCAGDSGAPGVRETATGPELVAINSRSWENGCILVKSPNGLGAKASRVDDASTWMNNLITFNVANGSTAQIRATGKNGNCLSVATDKTQTAKCSTLATDARKWQFTAVSGAVDTFTITNVATSKCLAGTSDPATTTQMPVVTCDPAAALTHWTLERQLDGTTALKNVSNGRYAQFEASADTKNTKQGVALSENLKWVMGSGDYFDLSASDVVAVSPDGVAYNLYQYEATGVPGLLNGTQMGTGWKDLSAGFVTDWNGDGFQDLLVQWSDGKLRLYAGTTQPFGGYTVIGQGWQGFKISVGKWKEADRFPSIVATDSAGIMRHYTNPVGLAIGGSTQIGGGWAGLEFVQMDFDKDLKTDIVAKNAGGELKLYRGNGTGGFLSGTATTVGIGWDVITAISPTSGFNGEGTRGMLARTTTGDLRYYQILDDSSWKAPVTVGWGWGPLTIFRSTMP